MLVGATSGGPSPSNGFKPTHFDKRRTLGEGFTQSMPPYLSMIFTDDNRVPKRDLHFSSNQIPKIKTSIPRLNIKRPFQQFQDGSLNFVTFFKHVIRGSRIKPSILGGGAANNRDDLGKRTFELKSINQTLKDGLISNVATRNVKRGISNRNTVTRKLL